MPKNHLPPGKENGADCKKKRRPEGRETEGNLVSTIQDLVYNI